MYEGWGIYRLDNQHSFIIDDKTCTLLDVITVLWILNQL